MPSGGRPIIIVPIVPYILSWIDHEHLWSFTVVCVMGAACRSTNQNSSSCADWLANIRPLVADPSLLSP